MQRYVIASVVLLAIALSSIGIAYATSNGVEVNVVSVAVPSELLGSIQAYLVPLNISSLSLLSEAGLYVVCGDQPRFSYLFSRNPPSAVIFETSAYSATYYVWYGGGNPYSNFIAVPGGEAKLWLAYDDFDVLEPWWIAKNVSIQGSRAFIAGGGYLALNTSYSPKTMHMFVLHGRRALQIIFSKQFNVFIAFTLTSTNFTDFNLVRDGTDIYFTDPIGRCLYYSVLYLDKVNQILKIAVNPANNTIIYMLYGSANPCSSYATTLS